MASYKCPLCGRMMERNLILFLNHADQHIMDQIKEEHPEWVAVDGVCQPCAEYYKKQIRGESWNANIGPEEGRKRGGLGIVMIGISLLMALIFIFGGFDRSWRLLLFFPIFLGMLGLIQARDKTCALLAERGLRNMDTGEGKIADLTVVQHLKIRGRGILLKSVLSAAALTLILFLIP